MHASNRKQRRPSATQLTFLAELMEHIAEGIALVDREGNLAYVNLALARLHGYEPEELIGTPLFKLYPADTLMSAALADLETKNYGQFTGELVHVRRDGSSFPVTRSSSLVRDEKGIPVGMAITIRDISETKLAEGIASESQAKLVRHLEDCLQEVSVQLEESRTELRKQAQRLGYAEEALKLMISHMEACRHDTEQTVFLNISEAVFPILDQLRAQRVPEPVKHLLTLLEFNLKSLFLQSAHSCEEEPAVLTPLETRLCELIGSGLTSKQIADATGVSSGTVNAHRFNIRKKLGLVRSGRPLASHLRQKFVNQ